MIKNWYLLLLCVPVILSSLTILGYLPKFEFLYVSIGIFSIVFITFFTRLLIKNDDEVIDEFILLVHYLPMVGPLFIGQLYFVNLINGLKDTFSILIYFTIAFMIFSVTVFILLKDMSFRSLYSILFNKVKKDLVKDSKPEQPEEDNISIAFLIGFSVPIFPLLCLMGLKFSTKSHLLLMTNSSFIFLVSLHLILGILLTQRYPLSSIRDEILGASKGFVIVSILIGASLVPLYYFNNSETIDFSPNSSMYIFLLLIVLILLSGYIASILDYIFSLSYKDKNNGIN